jgi:hypothetical protein
MKRTFNYTGRRKINHTDVSVTVRDERGAMHFHAELRLAGYQFPRDAEVWIEAHRQNLWMQFPWGTVSAPRVPVERKLAEFDVADGILFRVRVVQPKGQEHHKLLGEADRVPFIMVGEASSKRRPLLTPVPEQLDQLLWRLDFDHDVPRLLVNEAAKPSWKEAARSEQFITLVYPEVLRRVLTRTLVQEKWTEDDDADEWKTDWMLFARSLGVPWPPPPPPDEAGAAADCEAWIEEAVSAFARRNQLRQRWDLAQDPEGNR